MTSASVGLFTNSYDFVMRSGDSPEGSWNRTEGDGRGPDVSEDGKEPHGGRFRGEVPKRRIGYA